MLQEFVEVAARRDAETLILLGVPRDQVETAYQEAVAISSSAPLDVLRPDVGSMLSALGLPEDMFG